MSLSKNIEGYVVLGFVLIVLGTLLAVFSFFIMHSVPFIALGILSVVMGMTSALIPSTPVPAESVRAMMNGSCANIEALLEEFNAVEKCIYLPPKDGRVYAYVPLGKTPSDELVALIRAKPFRVIVEVRGEPGLMLYPPGSEVVRLAALKEGEDIEDALTYVLVDFIEAMESLKAIQTGDIVIVRMRGNRLATEFPRYRNVLGSLPTSIVGCVLSYVLGRPVNLLDENTSDKVNEARFKVGSNG